MAIFTLVGNADAYHVCFGINQLTRSSEPAGSVICLNDIYNGDKLAFNITANNVCGFSGENSFTRNAPDYSKRQFLSYFDKTPFTVILFDRDTSPATSQVYAAFSKDSDELNFITQILSCGQSDNKEINYIDSPATNLRFVDSSLCRMQLTNLCTKPIPEQTAASLVCLVLADWYSITSVNKQTIRF